MDHAGDTAPTVGSWPVAASVLAVSGLLFLDAAIGRSYLGVNLPALCVGATMAAALVLASRHLLVATVAAAGSSLGASWMVHQLQVSPTRLGVDGWPGMAELGGLALLTCWSLRSLRPLPALGAVAVVTGALWGILQRTHTHRLGPLLVLGMALVMGVAAGVGGYLRWLDNERRRDLDRVRQDERLAIARELHDVVAHHVTGIVVQAQAAQAVWERRPAAALDALRQIEAAGAEALGSMRRLVGSLRADEPGPLAPAATLHELGELAERTTALGLPVRLRIDPDVPGQLPADLAAGVHRIVQEALTNARRHARGATGVDVSLTLDGDHLRLEVRDDGRAGGAGRTNPTGFGLTGMAERAEALGGRFTAGPVPGQGWSVLAELPLAVGR